MEISDPVWDAETDTVNVGKALFWIERAAGKGPAKSEAA